MGHSQKSVGLSVGWRVARAKVWSSDVFGLIWECYAFESGRRDNWRDELTTSWRAVEADMRAVRLCTQPRNPAFPDGYTDFLSELGYQPDPDFPLWWSKEHSKQRRI